MATNTPPTRPSPVCPQATSSHPLHRRSPPAPGPPPCSPPLPPAPGHGPEVPSGLPGQHHCRALRLPTPPPGWIQPCTHEGIAGLSDRPPSARPGSPRLEERIRRRLAEPQARKVARLWQGPHRSCFQWGVPPPPPLAALDLGAQGHPDAAPHPRHQPALDPLRGHRAGLKGVGCHPGHLRRLPWAPSTGHGRLPLHSGRRPPPRPPSTAARRSSPPGGVDLGGAGRELANAPVEAMAGRVRQVQVFFGGA